jgi:predicted enzyme related to lactoylglutathione lyase
VVADDERAKEFYGAVLGWRFSPGTVEHGWQVTDVQPMVGLWGDPSQRPEIQLCYRVADVQAAAGRVREHGGVAGDVQRKPYGLLVECIDDQGAHFQLWQPLD